MKSKEYKLFRITIFTLTVLVFNFTIVISNGKAYLIWFILSILSIGSIFILERESIISLLKNPSEIKISRNIIFLLAFIIAYKKHYHYQALQQIGFLVMFFLQLVNLILFILVFCIKREDSNFT